MDNGLRKSTQSGKSSLGFQRTTQNILSLSRLLNSRCHPQKIQQQPTSTTLTFFHDEHIQTFKQFLHHLPNPLTILPIITQMKQKSPKCQSKLTPTLRLCFQPWLATYFAIYLQQQMLFWSILQTKINKIGFILLKVLERDHQDLAEAILSNNINHLMLVTECYEMMLANVLEVGPLAEFMIGFVGRRELYFLGVVVGLLVGVGERVGKTKNHTELLGAMRKYYAKNQEKAMQVCRSPIGEDFELMYKRLAKKLNY